MASPSKNPVLIKCLRVYVNLMDPRLKPTGAISEEILAFSDIFLKTKQCEHTH